MKVQLKTWGLLALAVVLLLLNVVDQGSGERLAAQLPSLAALEREQATRIEVSSATEKVILEREETPEAVAELGPWVTGSSRGPFKGEADQMLVRSIVSQFRKEVPIDVKVDEGNLEDYGLDATNGIVV